MLSFHAVGRSNELMEGRFSLFLLSLLLLLLFIVTGVMKALNIREWK